MKKYSTEQRKILLAFLEENPDQQFSIEEIADQVCGVEKISISSVYRNINAMVSEGSVGRFSRPGLRQYVYQYIGSENCSKHIHLKCEECGQLFHVNDEVMNEMRALIEGSNRFNIDIKKTIMYGVCDTCDVVETCDTSETCDTVDASCAKSACNVNSANNICVENHATSANSSEEVDAVCKESFSSAGKSHKSNEKAKG